MWRICWCAFQVWLLQLEMVGLLSWNTGTDIHSTVCHFAKQVRMWLQEQVIFNTLVCCDNSLKDFRGVTTDSAAICVVSSERTNFVGLCFFINKESFIWNLSVNYVFDFEWSRISGNCVLHWLWWVFWYLFLT